MTDSKMPERAAAAVAKIISDEEVTRVHGHANFGDMSPREVIADGVRKYAVGYTGGHTQLMILREHGLITKPKPGRYSADLTKKGKAYARALWQYDKSHPAPVADAELEALRAENAALKMGAASDRDDILRLQDELRARTAQPVGVTVKPLEWVSNEAKDVFGDSYEIASGDDGTFEIEHPRLFNSYYRFPSIEDAKAAAQADYEQRIRSQVIAAPITMQDAAKVLLDGLSLRDIGQDHPQITPGMTIAASMFLRALLPENSTTTEGNDQ